ncbi:MAG: hypothetical protein GY861_26060 [bacterium]|nr:hypothetical protein [bacterium]
MIAKVGQNLFDLAIQAYGNVENIVDLISDNDLDFNYNVTAGADLEVIPQNKGSEEEKKFIKRNFIEPSHGLVEVEYLAKYENETLITTEGGEFILVTK